MDRTGSHNRRLGWHQSPSIVAIAMAALCLAFFTVVDAEAEKRPEVEVKAALLYHVARYVEWPESAFFSIDSPLVIGVLGDPEFVETAKAIVSQKSINHRVLEVRAFSHISDARRSHILFIGSGMRSEEEKIRTTLVSAPVFAVSDSEGYAANGGTAHFFISNGKVRFAVNPKAASAHGLSISSKLLRVAKVVD